MTAAGAWMYVRLPSLDSPLKSARGFLRRAASFIGTSPNTPRQLTSPIQNGSITSPTPHEWAERYVWISAGNLCVHGEEPLDFSSPMRSRCPVLALSNIKAVEPAPTASMRLAGSPKELCNFGIRITTKDDEELIMACATIQDRISWVSLLKENVRRTIEEEQQPPPPEFMVMIGVLQHNEIDRRDRLETMERLERNFLWQHVPRAPQVTTFVEAESSVQQLLRDAHIEVEDVSMNDDAARALDFAAVDDDVRPVQALSAANAEPDSPGGSETRPQPENQSDTPRVASGEVVDDESAAAIRDAEQQHDSAPEDDNDDDQGEVNDDAPVYHRDEPEDEDIEIQIARVEGQEEWRRSIIEEDQEIEVVEVVAAGWTREYAAHGTTYLRELRHCAALAKLNALQDKYRAHIELSRALEIRGVFMVHKRAVWAFTTLASSRLHHAQGLFIMRWLLAREAVEGLWLHDLEAYRDEHREDLAELTLREQEREREKARLAALPPPPPPAQAATAARVQSPAVSPIRDPEPPIPPSRAALDKWSDDETPPTALDSQATSDAPQPVAASTTSPFALPNRQPSPAPPSPALRPLSEIAVAASASPTASPQPSAASPAVRGGGPNLSGDLLTHVISMSSSPPRLAAADGTDEEKLTAAAHLLQTPYRGAHVFSGVRCAGFVSKPPTVTSSVRRRFTGSKWVRHFLWLDPFGDEAYLHYGAQDGAASRSIPLEDVEFVGPLTSAELAEQGCPTATLDFGFHVLFGGDERRDIYFAVQKASERDAWITAVSQRARHAQLCRWEAESGNAHRLFDSPSFMMPASIIMAAEIDRRSRIVTVETDVRELYLGRAKQRLTDWLITRLRGDGIVSASVPQSSHNSSAAEIVSPVTGNTTSSAAGAFNPKDGPILSGGSFLGYSTRPQPPSGRLDGDEAFGAKGTWLYKTSRKKAKGGPESAASTLADRIADAIRPTGVTWSRRYAKVRGDTLVYSVEEHDDVRGTVAIQTIISLTITDEAELNRLKAPFPYGFTLRTKQHENVWCAESESMRDAWVTALERIMYRDEEAERIAFEAAMAERVALIHAEEEARQRVFDDQADALDSLNVENTLENLRYVAEQEAQTRADEAEAVVKAEKRRLAAKETSRPLIPVQELTPYCRALSHVCREHLSTAVSWALFDTDGLCLFSSASRTPEQPHVHAGKLASLIAACSDLHPNAAEGERHLPVEIILDLDKKVLHTCEVDTGLYAFSLAVAQPASH